MLHVHTLGKRVQKRTKCATPSSWLGISWIHPSVFARDNVLTPNGPRSPHSCKSSGFPIHIALAHPVFSPDRWPRRCHRRVPSNKYTHVLFRYSIDIHPVPIARKHVSNILSITFRTTARKLNWDGSITARHKQYVHDPCLQLCSNELWYRKERDTFKFHHSHVVQMARSWLSGGQYLNLVADPGCNRTLEVVKDSLHQWAGLIDGMWREV